MRKSGALAHARISPIFGNKRFYTRRAEAVNNFLLAGALLLRLRGEKIRSKKSSKNKEKMLNNLRRLRTFSATLKLTNRDFLLASKNH